jgi:hypothetical protein
MVSVDDTNNRRELGHECTSSPEPEDVVCKPGDQSVASHQDPGRVVSRSPPALPRARAHYRHDPLKAFDPCIGQVRLVFKRLPKSMIGSIAHGMVLKHHPSLPEM